MAAGRRGGYSDNRFDGLESDLGMVRKEIGDSNGGYGPVRSRSGEYERVQSRARDGHDHRVRIRQKDLKEREEVKGGYHSSSSLSDSGSSGGRSRGLGHSLPTVEREPGELSSDSSEGGFDSETVLSKEIESNNLDSGMGSPSVQNKRKFTPIVWDRDDRAVSRPAKISRHVSGTTNLPPRPPLVKSHNQSPNCDPSADANVQSSDVPFKSDLRPYFPEVPAETSPLPEKKLVCNVGLSAADDDDDYVPMRTMMSSRWANEGKSPADEGEISDYEDMRASSRTSVSVSNEVRGSKSTSPELDREGSAGTRGRSSESNERARSSSRDGYSDSDDRNNLMEIEDGRNYIESSFRDSDSEFDDDAPQPKRSVNMLQACRSVEEFEWLNKIDEGTYGVVSRAKDKKTGEIVALKKVKMEKEREGFPLTALREMNILLSFDHPSIVNVKEVVMGGTRGRKCDDISQDDIFMVMEYMEHDLKAVLETKRQPYSQSEVKCLMLQLIGGIKYLHDNWVLHRDLKTSNLLLNNRGQLKICDFGMARQYGSPLKPYTQLVVTLWYRAPELLLGAKQYSTAVDMWSIGCIMAELLSKEPLFSGKTEIEQLKKIFEVLGTPDETIWPGCTKLPGYKVNFHKYRYNLRKKFPATSFIGSPVLSDAGFDLLSKLLTYDPEKRITAEEALSHAWFSEAPRPTSKKLMPTYPPLHAQDRRMRRVWKSPDPLEEQRRKELQGGIGNGGLFGL